MYFILSENRRKEKQMAEKAVLRSYNSYRNARKQEHLGICVAPTLKTRSTFPSVSEPDMTPLRHKPHNSALDVETV